MIMTKTFNTLSLPNNNNESIRTKYSKTKEDESRNVNPNNNKESITTKYSKIKEEETRNVNNWNKHFNKLKETHSEEQDSNETDNLLKYAEKQPTNENCQIHHNYQKNNYPNYHRSCKRNLQRF